MVPLRRRFKWVWLAGGVLLWCTGAPASAGSIPPDDGLSLYNEKHYELAAAAFERQVQAHPADPWCAYLLGLSLWKAGRLEEAERALRRTLEIDPRHLKAHLNLGRVLIDAGLPEQAIANVEVAVSIAPGVAEAHRMLGRAHHCLGHQESAAAAYRRALQLDPHDAWAENNLGVLLLEQGRLAEARPHLEAAAELAPRCQVFQRNWLLVRSRAESTAAIAPSSSSDAPASRGSPPATACAPADPTERSAAAGAETPAATGAEAPASQLAPGTFRVKVTRVPPPPKPIAR